MCAQTFEFFGLLLNLIIKSTEEDREDVINLMMKRLGVQKFVIVLRQIFLGVIYCGIFAYLAALLLWTFLFKDSIGLGFFLVFVTLNQMQIILR